MGGGWWWCPDRLLTCTYCQLYTASANLPKSCTLLHGEQCGAMSLRSSELSSLENRKKILTVGPNTNKARIMIVMSRVWK